MLLGISEILVTKFIDIAAHVFYGLDRHAFSGSFFTLQAAMRLCAAVVFYALLSQHGVMLWAAMHLASGIVAAAIVMALTVRQIGMRPGSNGGLRCARLKVGVLFSIGLSANSVYTDIDKAVLARYASAQINGQYTAAYRLVYMAFTPVMAVLMATQGMFFRAGASAGPVGHAEAGAAHGLAGRGVLPRAGALLYLAAPLVAWALGPQYLLSVEILQALSLLPLVLMAQSVFSEALTGANRQRARSVAQVGVAMRCASA